MRSTRTIGRLWQLAIEPFAGFARYWRGRAPLLAAALMAMSASNAAIASDPSTNGPKDSTELTLDQLINIQVTSVAKKETRLGASPAAISVVTADDISRLGITSLPEALRLVPGMDVAQINGNQWAVSVRGFNGEFADKLLVLVDGRSVYTPASGGVFWNSQSVMMEDLDRIEVIRGPGATLWGANAVDGVINVVSKSARETQGLLLTSGGGSELQPLAAVRYGGELASNVYYRVYVQRSDYAQFPETGSQGAGDSWNTTLGGFRLDWEPPSPNVLTFQGDYYGDGAGTPTQTLKLAPPSVYSDTIVEHNNGGNLLSRWTHDFSPSSQLTWQTYVDHVEQGDGFGILYQNAYDFDLHGHFSLGSWNDFVVGTGYRYTSVGATPSFNSVWTPETANVQVFNLFAQDDITVLSDKLHLTLGSKLEYDSLVGWEAQPDGRILWTPTDKQSVWASVSRSTATPPLYALDSRINFDALPTGAPPNPPALVSLLPNHNLAPEELLAYQVGYRVEPAKQLSFDVAGFYNVYQDLLATASNAPRVELSPSPAHVLISQGWQNNGEADTYGIEISCQWRPTDYWRLIASYSWLGEDLRPAASFGQDPAQQFQLRSYLDLTRHVQLNGDLSFVDRAIYNATLGTDEIPAYLRADLGLVWRPRRYLEIGLWGENLLQRKHVEFPDQESPVLVEVPRSVLAKITLRF